MIYLKFLAAPKLFIVFDKYIETFEQSTDKDLLKESIIYTYKIVGNKLSYDGRTEDIHIVEVLKRIEDVGPVLIAGAP